jgi:precorrin-6B methylase 2
MRKLICLIAVVGLASPALRAQQPTPPYVPEVGQEGKDVIWVPSPPEIIEKMLDLAKVTPSDFVVDLGSGDGRVVIAAAKRGARALGVEFNADMVELSRRLAAEAGVADKATFVQGDMYEADISKATVLALFLLPRNLERLRPKFQALPAGTRIVLNTFSIPDWAPTVSEHITGNCVSWCTAYLYVLPQPR